MSQTITMSFTDGHGKRVVREVNQIIDVRDYLGTPGYSSLVVAANTHLSVADIERFLGWQSANYPSVYRPSSWIQRRRWTFQPPDIVNPNARANRDGHDGQAIKLMRENPRLSLRNLAIFLKERGITRGREWLRQHRCD